MKRYKRYFLFQALVVVVTTHKMNHPIHQQMKITHTIQTQLLLMVRYQLFIIQQLETLKMQEILNLFQQQQKIGMNMIGCLSVIHYGGNTAQPVNSFVENNDFIGLLQVMELVKVVNCQLVWQELVIGQKIEDFHQMYLKMIFKNGFQV